MNKIIIDSNIVFSALLNVNSRIGQILINGHKKFVFFAPEYVRFEIIQHQFKIKNFAKLSDIEFVELFELVLRNIKILNHSIIPTKFYADAVKLCESVDVDDAVFVAFAEYLKGKLWTGDKKLIKGLTEKGFKRLITTENIYLDFLEKES
jgi:predicted nucleic acid-binding protein